MIRALFSQVSRFHQRTLARLHRTDQLRQTRLNGVSAGIK
jgi:hypothetical protein